MNPDLTSAFWRLLIWHWSDLQPWPCLLTWPWTYLFLWPSLSPCSGLSAPGASSTGSRPGWCCCEWTAAGAAAAAVATSSMWHGPRVLRSTAAHWACVRCGAGTTPCVRWVGDVGSHRSTNADQSHCNVATPVAWRVRRAGAGRLRPHWSHGSCCPC